MSRADVIELLRAIQAVPELDGGDVTHPCVSPTIDRVEIALQAILDADRAERDTSNRIEPSAVAA